jgi:hypothetical protein
MALCSLIFAPATAFCGAISVPPLVLLPPVIVLVFKPELPSLIAAVAGCMPLLASADFAVTGVVGETLLAVPGNFAIDSPLPVAGCVEGFGSVGDL